MAKCDGAKTPRPTTVDVETFGIQGRPDYPPVPVGVAIKYWGKKGRYYSFLHATVNNCTREEAIEATRRAYASREGVLFHNAKFDLDVIETHFGIAPPTWDKVHDTTFLAYLSDPHARVIGLKPLAEKLLGFPPEEQDAVADWLVANQPVANKRITRKNFGEFIAYAPGDIVGAYALGDVERTELLFAKLYHSIVERGMLAAYDRERKIMPILLDMERRGIRVDVLRLQTDVATYSATLVKLESWLRARLGCGEEVNLDSDTQLIGALVAVGAADTRLMGVTATGRVKTDKAALEAGVADTQLAGVLKYRASLQTCLNTFMKPWLEVAERSGGLIFTNWNQIRGGEGGTRTGRFSSTPNFQNIPKEFALIFAEGRGKSSLPKPPFKFPPLPLCRGYIVPYEPGHVLVGRDYSQQEPRILAHFEDGALQAQYQEDPWIDYHDNAKYHIENLFGRKFERKPIKNINLGLIYGQGVASLAAKNGESYEATRQLKEAILKLYPGLKTMYADMRARARSGEPIRTWGGREYYCEPPSIVKGRIQEWDYKMVNVLVQGSAADCTKEGMIRFATGVGQRKDWYMILQVHDEIVISVPSEDLAEAQEYLRAAMESVEFDVKILSEGAWSEENWASMRDYDKKGELCLK